MDYLISVCRKNPLNSVCKWFMPFGQHMTMQHTFTFIKINTMYSMSSYSISFIRPLVKSAYQKINFLISQPKHMLWVLKRTVSMRQFFWAPITYVQTDGLENIYNFMLNFFVYLNQCFILQQLQQQLMVSLCTSIRDGRWRKWLYQKSSKSTKPAVPISMCCHFAHSLYQWMLLHIRNTSLSFITHPYCQDTGEPLPLTGKIWFRSAIWEGLYGV